MVPHQPRLDWQMWFAALGPHTHSPWFASLVLRLLQGKAPGEAVEGRSLAKGVWETRGGPRGADVELCPLALVIASSRTHTQLPFHKQPPTYGRAQRYKYWFSHPWEQG